ncbi:hypothetical protein J31TS6_40530 [Brevibacillus reuszeri]|uniref:phage tail-collar fiber domain-containing protein n=1 Tax=Brevibacillus reuszeri TaxID=54915 RepID=UPI001B12A0D0|nr:phage tail protein [Brevibacillus reuszeri]GIO08025.1 hypothetical protein J31TS6_40530 [Brevibacillus reuszeri]
MGAFGGITLTNKGRNLLAKAQTGVEIKYTRFGIGDGQLGGQSIVDLNALISQKQSLGIGKLKVQPGGKAVVGTVITNKNLTTGFYFREVGLFAQDPTEGEILYGYANCGPTAEFIPVGGGSDVMEKTFDVIIIIGNAQNVSAVLDSSLIWETPDGAQAKVDVHANNSEIHVTQADKNKWNALFSTPLATGNPAPLTIGGTAVVGTSTQAARADHKHPMPTATDTLNALKGVDGAGSGLDADLLDGKEGSAYALLAGGTFTGDIKIDAGLTTRLRITKRFKDSNGKYTTVEYRRKKDGTLFMMSVLSNPDSSGNYRTDTWSIYNPAGTSVVETVAWTIAYDAEGDFLSVT